MSVFLLKSPDAVFIHVPKTAGRSIREGAWEGRYEGPARGYMPEAWLGYYKFAFCRHPIDRMLSAYRMFTETRHMVPQKVESRLLRLVGIRHATTRYRNHKPLFPGLTLAEFLKIAKDESIALNDRTPGRTKRLSVLREHAVPQSHPNNLIDHADFVGRFEKLDEEMANIGRILGADFSLPHSNKTRPPGDWRPLFTSELYDEVVEYYREDFARFQYPIERYAPGD